MKKYNRNLVLLSFVTMLSGCASIFSSGSQEVTIESTPSDAEVFENGSKLGVTPYKVMVPRSSFNTKTFVIKKAGHDEQNLMIKKGFNKTSLWNLGFALSSTSDLGLTSTTAWGIDALTGGIIEYSPDKYMINLSKKSKNAQLEFILMNVAKIKEEISKGSSDYVKTLYLSSSLKTQESFESYVDKIEANKFDLLTSKDAPTFYRNLESKKLL